MIAIDTNILVYASRRDSPFHVPAQALAKELAEGQASWALPWACLHEFFAVVTSGRFYDPPTTSETALRQIAAWLDSPSLVLLAEGPAHFDALRQLLTDSSSAGSRVHDANIAAICIQHGVSELLTADRDFSRFHGVRTRNALLG